MKVAEHFYKETAEKLQLDYELVRKVNTFYWREGVKKNLSNANFRSLFIKNLGTITVSKRKLYKEIYHTIEYLRNVRKSEKVRGLKRENILKGLVNNLRQLLERRNELAIAYYKEK